MTDTIMELTRDEVAERIRRSPVAVVPFGSVEQHGPHLPNGTDTYAAETVAYRVASKLDGLLVPFGPYGITPIHAGHPGTINLRRATFEALLTDLCGELIAMGVRRLVFVNWHEGNIASLDAVAMEIQKDHPGVYVAASHACYVAQRLYRDEGGELTHGGGIEALAVMARDRDLVKMDRAGEATRPRRALDLDAMRRSHETRGFITDVTEIDDDGWYGSPEWANGQDPERFAAFVGDEVVEQVRRIFALREDA